MLEHDLVLTATDMRLMLSALDMQDVEYIQPKSSELASVVIALGGGVGIAAVIRSVGYAISKYFEGRAALHKTHRESVRVRIGDKIVEIDSERAADAANILESAVKL